MTTSVAYVTEEHFVLVKGALTRLALSILGGGVAMGDGGGLYGLLCRWTFFPLFCGLLGQS